MEKRRGGWNILYYYKLNNTINKGFKYNIITIIHFLPGLDGASSPAEGGSEVAVPPPIHPPALKERREGDRVGAECRERSGY
jgi:hypothetical protein